MVAFPVASASGSPWSKAASETEQGAHPHGLGLNTQTWGYSSCRVPEALGTSRAAPASGAAPLGRVWSARGESSQLALFSLVPHHTGLQSEVV
ncbi:sodium/glucose cotransporter 2 [Platysternon megacephalum]|uniref:Sodium/glucose cotransporter 2 n=1 Tax=Platysternon megacephalum TaxID=55544 RepID=A0A4D9DZL7_9SAUR|nr:sodium/glucose cotransporter 2 [Platysternon megacephalum]